MITPLTLVSGECKEVKFLAGAGACDNGKRGVFRSAMLVTG